MKPQKTQQKNKPFEGQFLERFVDVRGNSEVRAKGKEELLKHLSLVKFENEVLKDTRDPELQEDAVTLLEILRT